MARCMKKTETGQCTNAASAGSIYCDQHKVTTRPDDHFRIRKDDAFAAPPTTTKPPKDRDT
jgi:hypothetical protein